MTHQTLINAGRNDPLCSNILSKPQPQHNTMVGFDTKMTVQTPPTHPPTTTETFQALLDELESWNLAQTPTRPI